MAELKPTGVPYDAVFKAVLMFPEDLCRDTHDSMGRKRHHDHSNSHKENIELRRQLTVQWFHSLSHDGKRGNLQADIVLEK